MEKTFIETCNNAQREPACPCCKGSSLAPSWLTNGSLLIRGCQQRRKRLSWFRFILLVGEHRLHFQDHSFLGWHERALIHTSPPKAGTLPPSLDPTLHVWWHITWDIAAVSAGPTDPRSWASMQSSGATCNLCVFVTEIGSTRSFFLVHRSAFSYWWWLEKHLAEKPIKHKSKKKNKKKETP